MSEQPDNQAQSIHTDGGSIIKGKVEIGSDFVGRDKIIINNPVRRTLEDARRLQNRQAMLKLVHDIWVKGVLEHSLYNQLLIDLDIEQRPEAVERPWGVVLEKPDQASLMLPSGTKIIDVFSDLNQSLLILGEPGSGKSTMLYELARDLLIKAEQNPALPMPVLFNLSSWAEKRQPLRQWLVLELRDKYQIPNALAQAWVEDDELLLLLDGLDEVKSAYREDCIKALNEFQQSGKTIVPLALCSRTAEYVTLTGKLKLNGAIVLCPLTQQQIDVFLARAGDKLHAVAYLLQSDTELHTLAQWPLTLILLCLTYQGKTVPNFQMTSSSDLLLHQLFNTYIERMLQRPGKLVVNHYERAQTLRWLAWLAAKMAQYAQTEFLIEQLQPTWLRVGELISLYGVISRLIFGLIGGSISGLSIALLLGLNNSLIGGLIVGLSFGLCVSLNGTLSVIKPTERLVFLVRLKKETLFLGLINGLKAGLSVGLIVGLSIILTFIPFLGISFGLSFGLIVTIVVTLILTLSAGLIESLGEPIKIEKAAQHIQSNQGIWRSAQNMWVGGLSVGLLLGLPFWLLFWSFGRPLAGLVSGLVGGLIVGSFSYGGNACIQHLVLRSLLYLYNYTPFNYAQFLNYATERLFLRKVGGGYIFVHRLLMEHFASLTEEDIKRLAGSK